MVTKNDVAAAKKSHMDAYQNAVAVEQQFHAESVVPEMVKKIGTCWASINSFGGTERWPIYAKIIDVRDGKYAAVSFECMPDGRINIETETVRMDCGDDALPGMTWRQVTEAEYAFAAATAKAKLSELLSK